MQVHEVNRGNFELAWRSIASVVMNLYCIHFHFMSVGVGVGYGVRGASAGAGEVISRRLVT